MKYCLLTLLLLTGVFQSHAQQSTLLIRIAEIQVHRDSLEAYKKILKEEANASMRLEPGVISIFPMFEKEHPGQVRILEIYASRKDYEAHLKTPHFLTYKTTTLAMVQQLKLVEMDAIDPEAMPLIFSKLAH